MRSGIGEMKDENNIMRSSDEDKSNILNDFFPAVFTREGESVIKDLAPKTLDSLHDIDVHIDKVKKILLGLNPTKSCGPDECQPGMLKETADILFGPLHYFVPVLVLQSSRWGREICLSSWCLLIVVWLFLVMPWVCLQFVIVVFPDHTHNFRNVIGNEGF